MQLTDCQTQQKLNGATMTVLLPMRSAGSSPGSSSVVNSREKLLPKGRSLGWLR